MKAGKILLCFCMIRFCGGCQRVRYVTREQWLQNLAEVFYAPHIEDNRIMTLKEYGLIEDDDEVSDELLTKDYAAKTLSAAASLCSDEIINFEDEAQIQNLAQASSCVSLRIMEKQENKFDPTAKVSEQQAADWIEKAFDLWINPDFDNYAHIETSSPMHIIEDAVFLDESVILCEEAVNAGDFLFVRNEQIPLGQFFRIVDTDSHAVLVEKADISEVIRALDLEIQDELDFTDAIILEDFELITEGFEPMSTSTLASKTFEVNGYKVTMRLLNNGIKAIIEKKGEDIEVVDQLTLSNITPSFKWKSTYANVEYAYFKLNYTASHALTVNKPLSSGSYFDARKILAESWQADLSALAEKVSAKIEEVIPIARIIVPITCAPYLNIELLLQAKLSADGEIKLEIADQGVIGFEVVNNKLRIINDGVKNAAADINASMKALMQLKTSVKLITQPLSDLSFDFGAGATMSIIGHLKNTDGDLSDAVIGLGSLNILTDLIRSSDEQEILLCGDLSAHWSSNIKINSGSTLAYKLGLDFSKTLLDEQNAPLFDKSKLHIENFRFVETCTWTKARMEKRESYLDISSYQYSVKTADTTRVIVTSYPVDTTHDDLVFTSEDSSIARIDESGVISGVSCGTTRIYVRTTDGKYTISAAVVVSEP